MQTKSNVKKSVFYPIRNPLRRRCKTEVKFQITLIIYDCGIIIMCYVFCKMIFLVLWLSYRGGSSFSAPPVSGVSWACGDWKCNCWSRSLNALFVCKRFQVRLLRCSNIYGVDQTSRGGAILVWSCLTRQNKRNQIV